MIEVLLKPVVPLTLDVKQVDFAWDLVRISYQTETGVRFAAAKVDRRVDLREASVLAMRDVVLNDIEDQKQHKQQGENHEVG